MFGGDVKPRLDAGDYPKALFSPAAGDAPGPNKFRNNNVFALDADLRLRNVDKYFLPSRDLRLYGEFGWDDTCCQSNIIPLRRAVSILAGLHLLGLFGQEGLDARFEATHTSSASFTHAQFYRGYWTRGSVISHFAGTGGEDYFSRVTSRVTPNLMLGFEVDRAIVGNTVFGLSEPQERRVAGAIDLSYRFWKTYSLFAQYQLMHVDNRDFKRGDDGLDHLIRVELTRSFR
jgi:hypothetical protein